MSFGSTLNVKVKGQGRLVVKCEQVASYLGMYSTQAHV